MAMLKYVLSITARTHFTHSPFNSTWSTSQTPCRIPAHPSPRSTGDKPVKDPKNSSCEFNHSSQCIHLGLPHRDGLQVRGPGYDWSQKHSALFAAALRGADEQPATRRLQREPAPAGGGAAAAGLFATIHGCLRTSSSPMRRSGHGQSIRSMRSMASSDSS